MNEGVMTLECNGNVHTVNRAARRILGLEEHELTGRSFEEAFGSVPENKAFKQIFEKVVNDRLPTLRREVRFKRPDGQTVDLAVATSFFETDVCLPSMQDVVAVFRDVTTLKSLERMRRRAVDHLSHELKTPLAIIEASVRNLAKNDAVPASSSKALARIKRSLERLKRIEEIVEEIVQRHEFHPRPLNLNREIEEILSAIEPEFSHRSVVVLTDLEPIRTDAIDPELLQIVVKTLLKNAVEATPDEGEISVSFRRLDRGFVLEVDDRGVGIPVADREFILEGFHHIQETEEYSTRKPFDFGAGGKSLELLRLKMLAETGYFEISFESRRCRQIPASLDHCPGRVSACAHVKNLQGCRESGGTRFTVLFRDRRS
jgi:two-component system phosphate regulon sensor histidine kinase PhoR